ncbi:acetate/propionate family kinase [Botrimarina hoheduenensis]|uniref:Acetate kinase n=1 Tax=Botrimarina hoheduenensis TaxID=2528000 RepID=A0A5C5WAD6_9BACT|nr:acetate kinase [Botrimarina hoheduenensis]TWT47467.1 Acetate kinase [Botrimarina hoheduenensis]
MKVLVLNCGSSSIKLRLFEHPGDHQLGRGAVERIGEADDGLVTFATANGASHTQRMPIADHRIGMERLAQQLTEQGVLGDGPEVVAHRVVHGGGRFQTATRITDEVLAQLDRLTPLAPLHNPANVLGIQILRERYPSAEHIAVFDTAFHQTIPAYAACYALPSELAAEHGVKRYGFHGLSNRWASLCAAELLGKPLASLKMVVLHLGAGASATAIDAGRSIDTTMGLTPLEGLVMATRSGDLDPGVLLYLQRQCGYSAERLDQLLNRESGLKGLCGTGDLRDVLQLAQAGVGSAQLALDVYCYRIAKYVGAFYVALNGLDALVFTAGVGEHSAAVRRQVVERLAVLGLVLDEAANEKLVGSEGPLHAADSRGAILVVPANEELQIAREAAALVSGG